MKRIHYVGVLLKVTIPVYSHTVEEAREIAKDQLADFVSAYTEEDWEKVRCGTPDIYPTKPPHVPNDELVWGDGVPEEHSTIEALTLHLSPKET